MIRRGVLCLLGVLTLGTLAWAGDPNDSKIRTVSTPEEVLAALRLADGYEVNLFASEVDFPLHNPLSIRFDAKGRLWVLTSPTYPMYTPGENPRDQLLVLEDVDGDGVADKHTVFADRLYLPTGFALDARGVYLAQQPNLWYLEDLDGDLKADRKRVVLHGFGVEDSHHAASAFVWGPEGAFYFNEGVFHHTQVETPYGPQRAVDAAVFRYKPSTQRLTVISHHDYANPWGHAFDRWGQSVFSDASGGDHFNFASVIPAFDYPQKNVRTTSFLNRGRPTAGNLILSSGHFPEEVQGTHLNNQCIGFHGTRWDRLIADGSTWRTEPLPDLIQSSDFSYRPVDTVVGPDGALYICDWCNSRIGHMQYTHRDPLRDHGHGRIWRVTRKGRPLLERPDYVGSTTEALLALLRAPDDHVRHFARRELVARGAGAVVPALEKWLAASNDADPGREHLMLEALWVFQALDVVPRRLHDGLLEAAEPRARAAAVRALRHWVQAGAMTPQDALARLAPRVEDPDGRVRLEAVVACGFVPSRRAGGLALLASDYPMDRNFEAVLQQTLRVLAKYGDPESVGGRRFQLASRSAPDLAGTDLDELVATVQLVRADLPPAVHGEAIRWLGQAWEVSPTAALLRLLEMMDDRTDDVSVLTKILGTAGRGHLEPLTDELVQTLAQLERPESRVAVAAAIIRVDGRLERVMEVASSRLLAYQALATISDRELLESMYGKIAVDLARASDPYESPPMVRYVRVSIPGPATLTLAEVQVFSGGENIAAGGTTTQLNEAWGGKPERAIDGNSDGAWGSGTSTHTIENSPDPWWELDLGESRPVEAVAIWNRTDASFGQRLDGFTLELLNEARARAWGREKIPAPSPSQRYDTVPGLSRAERLTVMQVLAGLPVERQRTFTVLAAIADGEDPDLARGARRAMSGVRIEEWPAGFERFRRPKVDPEAMALGAEVYRREGVCETCHFAHGNGMTGSFPPLAGSEWVTGDAERLVKIVLHGIDGEIGVRGTSYFSNMDPLGAVLNDEETAAVLTYVRNQWGNEAAAIDAGFVARVREKYRDRDEPWPVSELMASHPLQGIDPEIVPAISINYGLMLGVIFGAVGLIGVAMIFMYRAMSRDAR